MPVDVLVGLQYGSEGKGKIAAHLADEYDASVRVGAWQAGHTIHYKGKEYKMQIIPCQWINPKCKIIIGAGGFIKLDILEREIKWIEDAGLNIKDRLYIDSRVTIGKLAHAQKERQEGMEDKIGSTQEGIGACLIEKIERKGQAIQAKDVESLQHYVGDTIRLIDALLSQGKNIFVEGTQGCHLSVVTSNHYPKCTSRDCNVSGILADCGISPVHVRHIIGVVRVCPIRVAGNSGDTGAAEITWDDVVHRSLAKTDITERTTVTKNIRRVFEFSASDMYEAIMINKPDIYALMFVDHINAYDSGKNKHSDLSQLSKTWIRGKEMEFGIKFNLLSTGKEPESMIDIRH